MAYAFQFDVPADEQFYRRVKDEIGGEEPKGLQVQLVIKHGGGLRHIGVWDSKEDWDRFHEARVEPALGRVFTAAGFAKAPPRPVEEELQVVDVL